MQSPARRAILIGMDGASMEVVINMVNGGHMPHLGKLMQRGVHRPDDRRLPYFDATGLDSHLHRRVAGKPRRDGFQHPQTGRSAR